jgi:hypothetical protein
MPPVGETLCGIEFVLFETTRHVTAIDVAPPLEPP